MLLRLLNEFHCFGNIVHERRIFSFRVRYRLLILLFIGMPSAISLEVKILLETMQVTDF
jgi:hypothetical protein